jgi:spore coat polysaccharide biosynthesis protein SpsF
LDSFDCQSVVRLTADCPLTDSEVIDGVIEFFLKSNFDYVSNSLERTFPRGLDVEVFQADVLREIANDDFSPMSREHVTYGIYTRQDRYSTANYYQNPSFSKFRWTVDTQADLDFVRNVYANFKSFDGTFRQMEILNWLEQFPEFAHFEVGEVS